ncbi:MAG TPA: amidohydrolase family protein [Actinomycetota bacterium]
MTEPDLPISFGPCSNGEYDPVPLSPVVRESAARARQACEDNARRLGVPRRTFLRSLCAASTVLLALDACTREAHRAETDTPTSEPGGGFEIPSEAPTEPEAAEGAIGGEEFIMDVQGHLLEYDLNPVFNGESFYASFPQQYCGEDDPRVCYSIEHFLEAFFIRSDTSVVVLSALPIYPEGSPLSPEIMGETRRIVEGLCRDERVLLHGQVLPNVGSLESVLDGMERTARRYDIAAWKTFTHFPDFFDPGGGAWWLDDHEAGLPTVGEPFIRKSVDLGITTICVHKGFSGGSRFSSPMDVGPAARANPDVNFVVYHSGYESGGFEGPFTPATAEAGVNRLIASLERAGIGPNENVYAELGSTWWNVMRTPTQAAHVLGKLLKHVGQDNVVWGTDCLFYGSPQPQIQAFRAFAISGEFQERYGYPALTPRIKAKVLGLNAARLYGIAPEPPRCDFTRRELAAIREELRDGDLLLGPSTIAASAGVAEHHRMEVSSTL